MSLYLAANAATACVGLLHCNILVLEMFYWDKPRGMKAFRQRDEELCKRTVPMAANQGLYNGFLAAGLFRGLYLGGELGTDYKFFFLGCVGVAGIFGSFTFMKKTLYVQTVPAALAATLLYLSL